MYRNCQPLILVPHLTVVFRIKEVGGSAPALGVILMDCMEKTQIDRRQE